MFTCITCYSDLFKKNDGYECRNCKKIYKQNKFGYIEFITKRANSKIYDTDTTTKHYAMLQEFTGKRVYHEYFKPLFLEKPFKTVLDAGCGIGQGIVELRKEGYEAYGVDLPCLSKDWANINNNRKYFFCSNITDLPFSDKYFDIVISLGVIEHVGMHLGQNVPLKNYKQLRVDYAKEILRVTKPNGRIFIAAPNKHFPIDIQHGSHASQAEKNQLREYLFNKTGFNIHKTWGKYHLLSFYEIKNLFCNIGGAVSCQSLPLEGYFSFAGFGKGFLKYIKKFVNWYIKYLPSSLRTTFLNPYVLVMIRKR